ncbi:sigma-54 dependent transcriptional regulator [uncultured Desulfobacter sp.]|uniref:sigma-54-dependent transcriptional regulator n=1 Tax=uncultured Desulfobacter sp. TaxID=240139 RepID=UPI002AAAF726|nr:sigma-54 dependent transcriptional regulator [uncultured Desulfobacter sp.]
MALILIIDDDDNFCGTMKSLVCRMEHDFLAAGTLEQGLRLLGEHDVDILLLDVGLPDGNGLGALPRIKEISKSSPEIFIITGLGDPAGAETAISEGVWDYIVKPTSIQETRASLTRALKYRKEKQDQQKAMTLDLKRILGRSVPMQKCFDIMAQSAASSAPVLITGETGTGKELFAQTIHANSRRHDKGFIVVDCAFLTETLMESTLFGHRKGAFTGAMEARDGLVKLADQGTLFLDEVGEMPLSAQKSFLRILQEKRFRPLGDPNEITSDFRLMAATNRDLDAMVENGTFRRDLLYRLRTIHLPLPPLRRRGRDIEELTRFKISALCRENNLPSKKIEQGFFDTLNAYPWPGNVRELFNVLETAFVASGSEATLYAMHLPGEVRIQVTRASIEKGQLLQKPETDPAELSISLEGQIMEFKTWKQKMERHYLEQIIAATNADVKRILSLSGLSKSHFYSLVKKYGIQI